MLCTQSFSSMLCLLVQAEDERWLFYKWQDDGLELLEFGVSVRTFFFFYTQPKWANVKDPRLHEGPMSCLWCSSGGKSVSLDL